MTQSGMSGLVVADSAICRIIETGDGLYYRGYSIANLAQNCQFEEVLYLLLAGDLPKKSEYSAFKEELVAMRELSPELMQLLRMLPPDSNLMDVLRTAYSFMASLYPEGQYSQEWICKKLLATCPGIMCYWYHYHQSQQEINLNVTADTLAEYFLKLLKRSDSYTEIEMNMVNLSLILYAEHEFNASTFTARVTTSTNTDVYSAICAAIGALRGNLHGGANEAAIKFLLDFDSLASVEPKLIDMIQNKEKVMGFGHRVYRISDPRSELIKHALLPMINTPKLDDLFQIATTVEDIMRSKKKLCTNVDYYTGLAYYSASIPLCFYTPLFVFGRLAGWSAHIFEQRISKKIIRPNANYTGPEEREFIPLEDRR